MVVRNPETVVSERLASGVAEKDIRQELQDQHSLPPEVARRLVNDVKAKNPEILEARLESIKGIRRSQRKSWHWTVLAGIGACAFGAMVVVVGSVIFGPGALAIVGAIAFVGGLATTVKGLWLFIR